MSVEGAKRLLLLALRMGQEPAQVLAEEVLAELETPDERARRLARERQQKRRSERDTSVTASREDPDAGHASVTPRAGPGHGDVTLVDACLPEKTAVSYDASHALVTLGGKGGDLPLSLKSEIKREGERTRERDTSVTGVTVVTAGARVPWQDDFELSDELRAFAEQAGVTDVPDVFSKFRSLAIEKQWAFDARGWAERWKRFAIDERKYQRKDRESGRFARVPETPAAPYHPGAKKPQPDWEKEMDRLHLEERRKGAAK